MQIKIRFRIKNNAMMAYVSVNFISQRVFYAFNILQLFSLCFLDGRESNTLLNSRENRIQVSYGMNVAVIAT